MDFWMGYSIGWCGVVLWLITTSLIGIVLWVFGCLICAMYLAPLVYWRIDAWRKLR